MAKLKMTDELSLFTHSIEQAYNQSDSIYDFEKRLFENKLIESWRRSDSANKVVIVNKKIETALVFFLHEILSSIGKQSEFTLSDFALDEPKNLTTFFVKIEQV